MIYVECKPDGVLARRVTDPPRRQVIHEAKGKGGVCNRLIKSRNTTGMVDEDPGKTQPSYMSQLSLSRESVGMGLKLYVDRNRHNQVVVLCPDLEEWLLRAASDMGLAMQNYGLPNRANELHRVINLDERKIESLLTDLTCAASPRLMQLGRLLTA